MKPTLLIMAAGMGSRYGGLKQIDPVGPGRQTILDYSLFDAKRAGFGKAIFIIRKDIEQDFKSIFAERLSKTIPIEWVFQELDNLPEGFHAPENRMKPWGTGHAVLMAKEKIHEPFAVINADDFYGKDAFLKSAQFLETDSESNDYAMVAYQLKNTLSENGTVSRGVCQSDHQGWLESIVENTKIARTPEGIFNTTSDGSKKLLPDDTLVSMNFWCFKPIFFKQLELQFKEFIRDNKDNITAEFYIPSAVDQLIKTKQARVKVLPNTGQWFGITYQEDKPMVIERISKLTAAGQYPSNF